MKTILETDRLRIREIEETDLGCLFLLDSDPEVMRYISDGATSTREQVEAGIQRARAATIASTPDSVSGWPSGKKTRPLLVGFV